MARQPKSVTPDSLPAIDTITLSFTRVEALALLRIAEAGLAVTKAADTQTVEAAIARLRSTLGDEPLEFSGKERFNSLMKQADFWADRVRARQLWERQLTFGLWAGLAGATFAIKQRPPEAELVAILAGVLVFYVFFWIRPVWIRAESDHRHAHEMQELALRLLSIRPPEYHELKPITGAYAWFGWLGDWGSRGQVVATVGLCVAIFFLLGRLS